MSHQIMLTLNLLLGALLLVYPSAGSAQRRGGGSEGSSQRRRAESPAVRKGVGTVADVEKAVVAITHTKVARETILGTGFIVNERGLIITADHVIVNDGTGKPYPTLFCLLPREATIDSFQVEVVKRFREGRVGKDVAVLRIMQSSPAMRFPFLRIGPQPQVGDSIFIAGVPNIFDQPFAWPIFRRGIIGSIRFSYEGGKVLILDLGSVAGFSGSPVVEEKTLTVVGVFKGGTNKNKNTGFSVASRIDVGDLATIQQ